MKEYRISIEVVKATPSDLKEEKTGFSNNLRNKKTYEVLREGLMYYLLGKNSNRFEGPYYLSRETTDINELAKFLKQGSVFIIKQAIDNKIKELVS